MMELTPEQKAQVELELQHLQTWRHRNLMLPAHMHMGLAMYEVIGLRPGDFLLSALKNDLRGAAQYADDTNFSLLGVYVAYFYNHLPSPAWGSPEKVEKWIGQHLGYMERSSE